MAIFDSNIDTSNFIKITTGGVQVATFAEIRDTLIKAMKKIYGNDIDIDSATADGQWINQIALIINNCCQCVKYSYDMLDPASATGSFLDVLCGLNNVQRIRETASVASLKVKNISGVAQNVVDSIQFIDKSGVEWLWTNPINPVTGREIKWAVGEVRDISDVTCQVLGPVIAEGAGLFDGDWSTKTIDNSGFINKPVEYGKWQIYQEKDAIVGDAYETDEALRARRIQSLGNQSVSVSSGLVGALLNVDGVKDVYVYNNAESSPVIMDDTTSIPTHSVYVCLRYDENINPEDIKYEIGNLIYNKLTPGIPTIEFDPSSAVTTIANSGESGEYTIKKSERLLYKVYWKICKPYTFDTDTTVDGQTCGACITILYNDKFDLPTDGSTVHNATTETETSIKDSLLNYLNNIELGSDVNLMSVMNSVQQGDILKDNLPTFFVKEITWRDGVAGADATSGAVVLPNTYINFPSSKIQFKETSTTEGSYKKAYVYIMR